MTLSDIKNAIEVEKAIGYRIPVREACLSKLLCMESPLAPEMLRTCLLILQTGSYSIAIRNHFVESRKVLWAIFPSSPYAKHDGVALPEHLKDSPVTTPTL